MPNMQPTLMQETAIPEDQASLATDTYDKDGGSSLRSIIEEINIAEKLSEEELHKIGEECGQGFEDDLQSRSEWDRCLDAWTKLAIQAKQEKTFPWRGAASVKYPLISTASMQFAARAYPALVPANGQVVTAKVVGKDPDGSKTEQAMRVSTYMSYQVMNEITGWEEGMDKLLIMLPVVGTMFKKTYWCPIKKEVVSELIYPKDLVVNYWTRCLADAERVSQVIPMSKRKLKERQLSKGFRECELGDAPLPVDNLIKDLKNAPASLDKTTPYEIIEQHTYLDLDDDGYAEPYIVTFHRQSRKVLRIVARYDESGVYKNEDGDIEKICPLEYFTKFSFVPNPDGSFYDLGFGTLLGPLNEAINTLINQLIDSGTLNNLQSGFLGKGLKMKLGESSFTPGEWKSVNATGTDLKQQILPLPSKEPSTVLFQLMDFLVKSGKELASVAEIFTGKMPGQNTPATTTMATVEQGMKVFTAVYKRVYRSLNEEFKKIYALNGTYMNPYTYEAVLDVEVGPEDFKEMDGVYTVLPGADPSASSQQDKMQKAQALMQLLPSGVLDPITVVKNLLEAMEIPNADKLFNQAIQQTGQMPPPPPDPKIQAIQMKAEADQANAAMKTQAQQSKMELDARDSQLQMMMKQREHQMDMANKQREANMQAASTAALNESRIAGDRAKMMQGLLQKQATHQQQMTQAKQTAAAQPKTQPKGGSK